MLLEADLATSMHGTQATLVHWQIKLSCLQACQSLERTLPMRSQPHFCWVSFPRLIPASWAEARPTDHQSSCAGHLRQKWICSLYFCIQMEPQSQNHSSKLNATQESSLYTGMVSGVKGVTGTGSCSTRPPSVPVTWPISTNQSSCQN